MLIKGTPPDEDGSVTINTVESDTLVAYSSSGNWSQKIMDVSKDLNGTLHEKTVRNYSGVVTKDKNGIEFEYDTSPGGIKGVAGAGLSYSRKGREQFFKRDQNNQMAETDEIVNDEKGETILLGSCRDIVKKTTNGFEIDGFEKSDTN